MTQRINRMLHSAFYFVPVKLIEIDRENFHLCWTSLGNFMLKSIKLILARAFMLDVGVVEY